MVNITFTAIVESVATVKDGGYKIVLSLGEPDTVAIFQLIEAKRTDCILKVSAKAKINEIAGKKQDDS